MRDIDEESSESSGAVYTSDINYAPSPGASPAYLSTGRSRGSTMRAFVTDGGRGGDPTILEERLHQIVVFELREDGTSEYSTMTLRALYNYVVSTITESCKEANQERLKQAQDEESRRKVGGSVSGGRHHNAVRFESDSTGEEVESSSPASTPHAPPSSMPSHFLPSLNSGSSPAATNAPTPLTSNTTANNSQDNHHDTPQHSAGMPPQLPSLTSGSSPATTAPTLLTSNTNTNNNQDEESPQQNNNNNDSTTPLYRHQRSNSLINNYNPSNIHRERLGGYLHPRDMRRLVTPFSSSNEPQLMVRRHVMLLNFDPLRAIVLRDRLLILVPDGADSILIELEKRVRGGIVEMENQVFGMMTDSEIPPPSSSAGNGMGMKNKSYDKFSTVTNSEGEVDATGHSATDESHGSHGRVIEQIEGAMKKAKKKLHLKTAEGADSHDDTEHTSEHTFDETVEESRTNYHNQWDEIPIMDWSHMPYELLSVDAVLQTVTSMLMDDARKVNQRTNQAMGELRGDNRNSGLPGEHAQERLRLHKDEVNLMEGRVQGFVRAMNDLLDDDEDMTLMNLSRLLTHPERFLQPVSQEILHEESDEPELILEAYLQQALSIVNELDLLKAQIMTTQEQIRYESMILLIVLLPPSCKLY